MIVHKPITAQYLLDKYWDFTLPIKPELIAGKLGIKVVGVQNLDCSGCIEANGDQVLISYNASESYNRKRFTVAHELGHFALGHVSDGVTKFRDTPESFSGSIRKWEEVEANRFAIDLLMPELAIDLLLKERKVKELADFAKAFHVSELAAVYRLKNLGILND